MMTDADLMKRIHERYGPLLDSVAQSSSARPEFLAALIANESGGDPDSTRFEPALFAALGEVLLGQKAAYGSIGAQDLLLWAVPGALPANGAGNAAADADAADAARRGFANQVQRLVAQCASRFGLDLAKDVDELFDCWNTGRPHAPTADPQYVPRGLARLQLYQEILAGARPCPPRKHSISCGLRSIRS